MKIYALTINLGVFIFIQGCHGQGKISGKMKFFPGQGKVREFCEWPGKFRKDLESHFQSQGI